MSAADSGVARVCWCLGQWLPLTEIVNLKKKTFICLSNLKFVERRKLTFSFKIFILLPPGLCPPGWLHHLTVAESK